MSQSFSFASSVYRHPFSANRWIWLSVTTFFIVWVQSLIRTNDLNNWLIENLMTVVAIVFMWLSYRRYRFSDLTWLLVSLYICLHIYGSQYTYAENPFGYQLKAVFNLTRNPYDRLVHFSQGFLLAYAVREMCVYWLKFPAKSGWLMPLIFSMSTSALYEMLEWGVADIFFPELGPAYLGLQGDVWDAQKDTFCASLGALLATIIISGINLLRIRAGKKGIV